MRQVNVGCGEDVLEGWDNVDIVPREGAITADCCDLPYEDETVDYIRAYHLLEHLTKPHLVQFSVECHRLLRPGGKLEIVSPDMETLLGIYWRHTNQESIEFEDFVISPTDWLDNLLFSRHLHDYDYHRQGIYQGKLQEVFHRFTSHQFRLQDRNTSRWEIHMECHKAERPKCSVVMSTRNKSLLLQVTLASIHKQRPPFSYEVIVVDDGSTDDTHAVCRRYGVQYYHLENPRYRNPSRARNAGYRAARGEIIVSQSDDIVHMSSDTLEKLVTELRDGEFTLAQVHNYHYRNGKPFKFIQQYCGPEWRVPYFFLGAIKRSDLYAVGGCDEEFVEPCYDDNWFADCLMLGLKLRPRYLDDVLAHHQSHSFGQAETRCEGYEQGTHTKEHLSRDLYRRKSEEAKRTGVYMASGGSWDDPCPAPDRDMTPSARALAIPAPLAGALKVGKIPPHVNFFWAGEKMSWMRYMTLRSFCHWHSGWDIVLNVLGSPVAAKSWRSGETQDSQTYSGRDYLSEVENLPVRIEQHVSSKVGMAAAHSCDLFQWYILGHEGGVYCDMDLLFTGSLPYDLMADADAVFCLSDGFMAIGLVASGPGCRIFKSIQRTAEKDYSSARYQSTGAEAVYHLCGAWPDWGNMDRPGDKCLTSFRELYPEYAIVELPSHTVYPFTYREIDKIFSSSRPLPPGCSGIHWFGGAELSQQWNNRLTHENFSEYDTTFCREASKIP